MRKFLPLLAAILAIPGFAAAAEPGPLSGELTVAYGWAKKADGTRVNLAGLKLPYHAYPVKSYRVDRIRPLTPSARLAALQDKLRIPNPFGSTNGKSGGAADSADQVVYSANFGDGYGVVPDNPSSLDDIVMSPSGTGKPWTKLTFGMNYNSSSFSPFIIRWRCYGTNVDNPAPQNDFSEEFADFGVRWSQSLTPGSYVVEIDVAQAAVSTTDTSFFMAQQFRAPHPFGPFGTEDGEGEFLLGTVDTVFNASAAPTTGSSENQFWYDWDPAPDGNYENSEIDIFEGSHADHVLTIKVSSSGSSTDLTALNAAMGFGRFVSGNLLSVLNAGDNNDFKIWPAHDGSRQDPVGSINVDFYQPVANVSGIRLTGRVGAEVLGVNLGLDLYDFVDNKWVQVNAFVLPNGYITFNESYGGIVGVSHFTGTVNHPVLGNVPAIRARVRFKNSSDNLPKNWIMKLDQMKCTVTSG